MRLQQPVFSSNIISFIVSLSIILISVVFYYRPSGLFSSKTPLVSLGYSDKSIQLQISIGIDKTYKMNNICFALVYC